MNAEILRELLDYNSDTGLFVWRFRERKWFKSDKSMKAWNSRFAGVATGSLHHSGYVHLTILSKFYAAHRIAWLYVYGEFPDNEIDHKDGNKSNNRILNLRDVTPKTNSENKLKVYQNSKSGIRGVSWHEKDQKWRVRIRVNGKLLHIGNFTDITEAEHAAIAAKRKYHEGCTF